MILRNNGKASGLRQIIAVLTVFCLLLIPFRSIAQADPVGGVSVEVESVTGAPGQLVDVAVTMDPANFSIEGYELELAYDPDVLELVDKSEALTDLLNGLHFEYMAGQDGVISSIFSFYPHNSSPLITKEEIFVIHFKIKDTAVDGNSSVNITLGKSTLDFFGWDDIPNVIAGNVTVDSHTGTNPSPSAVEIQIGDVSGNPGEEVDVPVTILEAEDSVAAYGIQLDFASDSLEVVDVVEETGDYFDFNYDDSAGWLKVAWVDIAGGDHAVESGDTLFTVKFKIKDDATTGDKEISVSNENDPDHLTFTDIQLNEMEKSVVAGKVTVNALTNAEAPTISAQPEDRTVNVGDTADLSVTATASGDVSYQWYSNTTNSTTDGTEIAGATNATFTAPTDAAGTMYYYVVVTNTDNSKTGEKSASVTSSVVQVVVNTLTNAEVPTISAQPEDRTVNVGDTADLSVTASASGEVSYQWYSNTTNSTTDGTAIAEATNATFNAPTDAAGTMYYYVVVTNTDNSKTGEQSASVTSSVAKVVVNMLTHPETIQIEIGSANGAAGDTVDIPVVIQEATGAVAAYGIQLDFASDSLEVVDVVEETGDFFDFNYDDSAGWLKVAWVDIAGGDHAAESGDTLFTVKFKIKDDATTGDKEISVSNENDPDHLTFTDIQLNEMEKSVVAGKVTVNALTNAEAPTISTQPEDRTVNIGSTADLSVTASASGEASYQWYSNTTNSATGGTAIAGATNATFTAPTNAAGTTYYYVVITNTDSSKTGEKTATVTSSVAKVVVNTLTNAEAPTISAQPEDRTVSVGGTADLSVTATASGEVSYQWYSNATNSTTGGTAIAGATNATFTAPTNAAGTTYYYVVITNTDSSKTGEKTATVTSSVVKVVVNTLTNAEAPTISAQPEDRTVNIGSTADLSVTASASGNVSYQWYSNTTNSTTGGTAIAGATNATFTAPTNAAGTTYYYVVITNTDSSKTGEKTATVTSSVAKVVVNTLTNAEAPTISVQPEDRTVNIGSTADLSVTASASGEVSYQWYSNTTNSTTGGTAIAGATNATFTTPTSVAGTTYYYVVVTNTDSSKTGEKTATVTSSVAKVVVNTLTNAEAPTISTQPEDRTVSVGGTADLSVTAAASGEVSYQWYSNTTNSTTGGTAIAEATNATFTAPTNAAGTTYYYVVVTNTDSSKTGEKTATVTSSVAKVTIKKKAPSTSEPSQNEPSEPEDTGVDVIVNGKPEKAGTAVITQIGGKKVTTVIIDQKKLDDKLAAEDKGATVIIPVYTDSNVVVGELNGQMVKHMEQQQAKLVIQTKNASYTLPAVQINIDSISGLIGSEVSLQDIKVQVKISDSDNEMIKVVQSASDEGSFDLIVPPVEFIVTGQFGGKTVEVSKFNAYVERTITLPEGVDASQVTTAIVIDSDGTVRHVPTQITVIDGKYFAKINSLTNSTYSVIWNPVTFNDVEQHWAKEAINDIGSRMIINGVGDGKFDPNRDITRAEFAAIIVRGLGLKPENSNTPFTDVASTDWFSGYVGTAQAYNLIDGFADGSFRPMEKITREQAMVILAKAAAITGLNSGLEANDDLLNTFSDSSQVSAWATTGIRDCLQAGIVLGRNHNQLEPQATISRAEVAIMVQRLLQLSNLI